MRDMQEVRDQQKRRKPLAADQDPEEVEDLEADAEDGDYPSLKGGISDARILGDAEIDTMIATRETQ